MKKLLFGFLLFFFVFNQSYGQDIKEELKNIEKSIVEAKKKYWRLKEKIINEKKIILEKTKETDEEIKLLFLRKEKYQEDVFLTESKIKDLSEEYSEKQQEEIVFYNRILEITQRDKKKLQSLYPYLIPIGLKKLNEIEGLLENNSIIPAIGNYISYRNYLLHESEKITFGKKKILISDGKAIDGYYYQVGFIQNFFKSSSTKDVAILLKNNHFLNISYEWKFNLSLDIYNPIKKNIKLVEQRSSKDKKVHFPIDVSQSGSKLKNIIQTQSSYLQSLKKTFNDGGIIMYPLLLILIIGIIALIERLYFYFILYINFKQDSKAISQFILKNNLDKIYLLCQRKTYFFTVVINQMCDTKDFLLENQNEIEIKLNNIIAKEIYPLDRNLRLFKLVASISPLLGLLGTVIGMITLFETITVYGTNNPKILAGGISIALITTQTGLIIAIPMMLLHYGLSNVKNKLMRLMYNQFFSLIESWIKVK